MTTVDLTVDSLNMQSVNFYDLSCTRHTVQAVV